VNRRRVVFELPPAQGASLGRWLSCAAVVSEVCADGVLVDARANRVFDFADLATLVREWMQSHCVDAVIASSDGAPLSIAPLSSGVQPSDARQAIGQGRRYSLQT
jgi:hypothetical protein